MDTSIGLKWAKNGLRLSLKWDIQGSSRKCMYNTVIISIGYRLWAIVEVWRTLRHIDNSVTWLKIGSFLQTQSREKISFINITVAFLTFAVVRIGRPEQGFKDLKVGGPVNPSARLENRVEMKKWYSTLFHVENHVWKYLENKNEKIIFPDFEIF